MRVTVYAKPGCQPCKLTIRQLDRLREAHPEIEYEQIDVTADPDAMEACRALGYLSAPVVVAGDQHWAGFRPDRIDALVA